MMWKKFLPAIAIVSSFFKGSPGDFRIPFRWDCSMTEPLLSPWEAHRVQFVSLGWRVKSTLWVPVW